MSSTFLTDDTRKLLAGGVSIMLGVANAQLISLHRTRAKGCALAAPKLRAFVSLAQAPDLVEDVRSSRMISVSFSVPSTHQSMELKGADAKVLPIVPAEREVISSYVQAFVAAIAPLGFSGITWHFLCFSRR